MNIINKMPKAFDTMVSALKKQLQKDHLEWDDEKCNSSAYAIATSNWKKTHGGKSPTENLDSEGRIIVGENVKLYLDSSISVITE